ncbi:hypothetical protein [Hydrocarboniphaga sp.]|uniref:hypothetical protein n=1 Tax=Hydrocarboniphaga sp. TaxID=2033016 RepID=UPI003D0C819C
MFFHHPAAGRNPAYGGDRQARRRGDEIVSATPLIDVPLVLLLLLIITMPMRTHAVIGLVGHEQSMQ